jgi:hypothetical protein
MICAIATLLLKHLKDCDSNSLRSYTCDNATRLIAKMPFINNKCYRPLYGPAVGSWRLALTATLAIGLRTSCETN